jgi:type IV pilus assembly protein PilP
MMRSNWVLALIATSAFIGGCGGDSPPQQPKPNANAAPANAPAARGGPPQVDANGKPGAAPMPSDLPPLPTRQIGEPDFVESPSNRDPFRNYADLFKAQAAGKKIVVQRNVLANKFALEELRIKGIMTGELSEVMLDDPSGTDWRAKVGDYVGKPEVVHSNGGQGADVTVNWRIDKIRPNDVIFIREDPSAADVAAPTRTLSLRTQDELNPDIKTGVRPAAPPPPPPPLPGGVAPPPPAPTQRGT